MSLPGHQWPPGGLHVKVRGGNLQVGGRRNVTRFRFGCRAFDGNRDSQLSFREWQVDCAVLYHAVLLNTIQLYCKFSLLNRSGSICCFCCQIRWRGRPRPSAKTTSTLPWRSVTLQCFIQYLKVLFYWRCKVQALFH